MKTLCSKGKVWQLLYGGMGALLLFVAPRAVAQVPLPTPATTSSSAVDADCAPVVPDPPVPSVIDAYREMSTHLPAAATPPPPSAAASRDRSVRLRDTIVVEVRNLESLLRQQRCDSKSGPKRSIVLYLDDRPLIDALAQPPQNPAKGVLAFPLKRTETSRDVWTYLLGKPYWNSRPTRVSVGIEDRYGIESTAVVQLVVLPRGWFIFWLILLIAILLVFAWFASKTNILRYGDTPVNPITRKPWSLAKAQAAWWFFLVLASYLFIGLVTGDYGTSITGTVLVLLGIAAATTLSAAAIDQSKATPEQVALANAARQRLGSEVNELETNIQAAEQQIAASGGSTTVNTAALAAKLSELAAKRSQLRKLNYQSEGLLRDILSDANGVSFHRFQIAVWTVVIGIVFVVQVFRELAMPQFSETLLALMGLSAGTYVAMKVPEANVPK